MTTAQLVVQRTKLRILDIAFEALAAEMPKYYGVKEEDVRRDASDMAINIWATLEDHGVRRKFQVKVEEVR